MGVWDGVPVTDDVRVCVGVGVDVAEVRCSYNKKTAKTRLTVLANPIDQYIRWSV